MCGKLLKAEPPRIGSTHGGGGRSMLCYYPPLCTHRHLGLAVWSPPHQPNACTQRVPALHPYKQSYGNPPLATNMGSPNPVRHGMGPACSAFRVQANERDACAAQSNAPCACRLPMVVGKHYARRVQRRPRSPMSPECRTAKLVCWLTNNAVWNGNRYTDREMPTKFRPEGYTPTWCDDIALLRSIAAVP